jgi:hypothetical protein
MWVRLAIGQVNTCPARNGRACGAHATACPPWPRFDEEAAPVVRKAPARVLRGGGERPEARPMMKQIAAVLALLTALPAQAQAHAPKSPKHLIINVACGGFELWYQDGLVWGAHGSCGAPNVTEGGVIAKMGSQRYIVVTATYPNSGLVVTTRFTMPVDGQGTWDSYVTDGESAPSQTHGSYTTS